MLRVYVKLPRYMVVGIICISLLLVAACCGGIYAVVANAKLEKADKKTVILDAGHGGVDPGAIGVNGENEKDINLDIVLTLGNMLKASGYNVIYTRTTDTDVAGEATSSVKQLKTKDLKNRLKLFGEHKDAVVISVHQNKYSAESSNGAQMFFGKNNPESEILAQHIQLSIKENLQPKNNRVIKQSTSDVYIINNAKNPCVLVECGFLSNNLECKLLSTQEYRNKMAFCIYIGILKYCDGKGKQT